MDDLLADPDGLAVETASVKLAGHLDRSGRREIDTSPLSVSDSIVEVTAGAWRRRLRLVAGHDLIWLVNRAHVLGRRRSDPTAQRKDQLQVRAMTGDVTVELTFHGDPEIDGTKLAAGAQSEKERTALLR